MSIETTPSKKVCNDAVAATRLTSLLTKSQAASGIESLKMESPVKMQKLSSEANKENIEARYEADEVAVPIKGIPEMPEEPKKPEALSVAPTIKEDEAIEPILQENPQRFVLFPIKYHEVRAMFTRARVHA